MNRPQLQRRKGAPQTEPSANPKSPRRVFSAGLLLLIIVLVASGAASSRARAAFDPTPKRPFENFNSYLPLVGKSAQKITSRPLGQVAVISTPTDCGGDHCYNLRITCPDVLQTRDASLKVGEPTGSSYMGTILFATGWVGDWYWGDAAPTSALAAGDSVQSIASNNTDIINHLKAAGYRTVELKWTNNWFQAASGQVEGMARLACRPASVIRWVYDNIHLSDTSKPYCASGQSNGASQVSYALAQYGLSNILSAVINESGPNWSREDDHCISNPDFPALFGSPGDRNTDDWAFGFLNDGNGPCAKGDPAYKQQFINASLQYGHWQFSYPHTLVAFVFGGSDTTATKAQGQAFYDFLLTHTTLLSSQVVPGADHFVTDTIEGAQVMENTIKSACVLH
jgi:hypothetical protein